MSMSASRSRGPVWYQPMMRSRAAAGRGVAAQQEECWLDNSVLRDARAAAPGRCCKPLQVHEAAKATDVRSGRMDSRQEAQLAHH